MSSSRDCAMCLCYISATSSTLNAMFSEFKKFIMRGNVMDLAVGVIIGAAFGKIVTSLVNDVLMPVVSLATGKIDFSGLFISLNGQPYARGRQESRGANAQLRSLHQYGD